MGAAPSTQRLTVRCTQQLEGRSCEIRRRIEIVADSTGMAVRCLDATLAGEAWRPDSIEGKADGSRLDHATAIAVKGKADRETILATVPLASAWAEGRLAQDGTLILGLPGDDGVVSSPQGRWPGEGARVDPLEDPAWFHLSTVPDAVLLLASHADGPFEHRVNTTLVLEGTLLSEDRGTGGRRRRLEARLHGPLFPNRPTPTIERTVDGEIVQAGDGSIVRATLRCSTRALSAFGERTTVHELEVAPDGAAVAAPRVTRADFAALRADPRAFWGGILSAQVPRAREMLQRVRPKASIDGVKVEPWLLDSSYSTPDDADEDVWYAGLVMLVSDLGLLTSDEAKDLVGGYRGSAHGPAWAAAAAFFGQDRVLVKPGAMTQTSMLVHELAHVADDRLGRAPPGHWMRKAEGRNDPTWGDLDAAIAGAALLEAGAVLTATLAELAETRPKAIDVAWRRMEAAEPEEAKSTQGLLAALLDWLYGASAALVGARHRPGEGMEEALERAWSGYSFTTRELIAPRGKSVPSAMWSQAMARMPELQAAGAVSGTRIGSLVVRQIAVARGVVPWKEASPFALTLSDDLLVRDAGGLTWITRWGSETQASRALPRLKRMVSPAAAWEQRGNVLVARVGEPSADMMGTLGLP